MDKRSLLLMAAVLSLALTSAACGTSRLSSGHPLESTTVEDWKVEGGSLIVHVSFRDDAPSYGCLLEAFDEEGESLGYARARPMGQEERELVMRMEVGHRASAVDNVEVTDCDM